jgi:hypothetical protein
MSSTLRRIAVLVLLAEACGGGTPPAEENVAKGDTAANAGQPPPWFATAFEQPRGLLRNEPGASPGYVIFAPFNSDATYLVDLEGRVVHTWKNDQAGDAVYFQDDGSLIRLARIPEPPSFRAGGVAGYIQKLSWEGDLLWEWRMADEQKILHHDIRPLENGNILALAWEQKSAEEAMAVGRLPEFVPAQGVWSEWIAEIEPRPPRDARMVWEWHLWDHLVQGSDAKARDYGVPGEHPERLDVNGDRDAPIVDAKELEELKALGYVPSNASAEDVRSDWVHVNSIDYHPRLDQVLVSARSLGEIWILDHSTTSEEARGSSGGRYGRGGDILYRWGNPKVYGRGTPADQQLFGQHQALWIPDGWKNAGNVTVFNNGAKRSDGDWSSVVEIALPVAEDGTFRLSEGEPFGPAAPVWAYAAPDKHSFFASFVSGAHRLPGGNTFVCSGPQGRFFEVTPEGNILWEYRGPFHGELVIWQPELASKLPYGSFRAIKIPSDHPGLSGRRLSPLDPQPPSYVPPSSHARTRS